MPTVVPVVRAYGVHNHQLHVRFADEKLWRKSRSQNMPKKVFTVEYEFDAARQ